MDAPDDQRSSATQAADQGTDMPSSLAKAVSDLTGILQGLRSEDLAEGDVAALRALLDDLIRLRTSRKPR